MFEIFPNWIYWLALGVNVFILQWERKKTIKIEPQKSSNSIRNFILERTTLYTQYIQMVIDERERTREREREKLWVCMEKLFLDFELVIEA